MNDQTIDRRQGPDLLCKAIRAIGLFCSLLLVLSLLLIDRAKPRIETFFDRLLGVHLRTNWDNYLLEINLYVVAVILLLSLSGLLVNSFRTRRKSDHYSRTLLLLTIISSLAIIFFRIYDLV